MLKMKKKCYQTVNYFMKNLFGIDKPLRRFAPAYGLRLPASTSCKGLHSCPAGRGPNNSSLHPPLAAVVVVA